MLDLLLFWEEAGVALAQGTVRPPKAGQPGGWAGRGDNVVAGPCVCPLSTRSLVTLPLSPWQLLAQARGPDLRAPPAQRRPPQPPPRQARRNWQEMHGQPYCHRGGRAAAGARRAPPTPASGGQLQGWEQVGLGRRWGTAALWQEHELRHPGWRPAGRCGSGSELTQ